MSSDPSTDVPTTKVPPKGPRKSVNQEPPSDLNLDGTISALPSSESTDTEPPQTTIPLEMAQVIEALGPNGTKEVLTNFLCELMKPAVDDDEAAKLSTMYDLAQRTAKVVSILDESLKVADPELDKLIGALSGLMTPGAFSKRASLNVGTPTLVPKIDALYLNLVSLIAPIEALNTAVPMYLDAINPLFERLQTDLDQESAEEALEELQQHGASIVALAEEVEKTATTFPSFCGHAWIELENLVRQLSNQYSNADSADKLGLVGGSNSTKFATLSLDVPVYSQNLLLTAYLHEIGLQIPQPLNKRDSSNKKLALEQYSLFLSLVESQADPVLFAAIKDQTLIGKLGEILTHLETFLRSMSAAIEKSGILELSSTQSNPIARSYTKLQSEFASAYLGSNNAAEILQQFDSSPIRDRLDSLCELSASSSKDAPSSKRDKTYLKLFKCIERFVQLRSNREPSSAETKNFLKKGTSLITELRKSSATSETQPSANQGAFRLSQDGRGNPSLAPLRGAPARDRQHLSSRWDSPIEEVNALIVTLQQPAFSSLFPSSADSNPSLLILGPNGSDENHFFDYLHAQNGLISVSLSSSELLTLGETALSSAFELAARRSKSDDKPALITVPDIDAAFQGRNMLPKLFTSTMSRTVAAHGDKKRVGLVVFSANPTAIPTSQWSHFGKVVILPQPTTKELRTSLQEIISELPLSFDTCSKDFNWTHFDEATGDTNVAVVRKIYDSLRKTYTDRVKQALADSGKSPEALAAEKLSRFTNQAPPTFEDRLRILTELAPHVSVTASDFYSACQGVGALPEVAMTRLATNAFYNKLHMSINKEG